MTEIEKENIKTEEKKQEQVVSIKEEPQVESPPIKSEENQANWRKFREEREAQRKALAEAEERARKKSEEAEALKKALEAITDKPQKNSYYDEFNREESEEEKYRRIAREEWEKEQKKQEEQQKEEERRSFPTRLRKNMRDFDQVCTQENLDYFEFHYPELAKAYSHMPDGYDKWENVYKAIKRFIPYQDKESNAKLIEQNLKKPQSPNSVLTNTETSGNAWKLTEERKRENWLRMRNDQKFISS